MSEPEFTVELMNPADLAPHPRNFRRHPAPQRAALDASLTEHGWLSAPIWNKRTQHLLDGHARVEWAEGREETIPVRVIDVPARQEQRILRAFDQIGAMAEIDDGALEALIEEIGDVDLERLLGEIGEPESGLLPEADPDAIPEVVETRCKAGDLWMLGDHRLLCGDSTKRDDVERLFGDEQPILMVTDPPYGVDYDPEWRNEALGRSGAKRSVGQVQNDHTEDWGEAYALCNADVAYVWHASMLGRSVANGLEAAGFLIRSQIIWAKSVFALSRADYHWKHEACWYAVRKNASRKWNAGRDQTTLWEVAPLQGYASTEEHTGHGTQKPIALFLRPVEIHTDEGDTVYDPFAGSGTTLIACEQTGRVARCMEIEPRYADVILARWEQATGRTARRAD